MSPCKLLPFCVALALTGCSLAPDYQRPAMPVPQQFSLNQNGLVNAADNYQNAGWRTFFVDNQVKTLISEALVNNRDLRMAALKVQEARILSRLGLTAADLEPKWNCPICHDTGFRIKDGKMCDCWRPPRRSS